MKKLSAIIIAMALVLGMSQCKKQETPTGTSTEDGMVYITVNVENGGGRHHIEPSVGAYVFTNGDVLYVGNGGHYVGSLTYTNGAFTGGIENPVSTDYLHFYFLGGKGPQSPSVGTESFTISIADQSSNLPILSYGHSAATYTDGNATYSTTLRNKCALVKFDLLAGTTDAVTVANMLTEATINFGNTENAIVPTATEGTITLYPESEKAKWAILLPQEDAIEEFSVNIGTDPFSVTGSYTISNNGFINSGIVIDNSVNLNNLTGDYNAQDGDVLTGNTSYKVYIPSGATVTLNNVNINGGGILCSGNATIVLENSNYVKGPNDYPGIHIAQGSILTIQGDGEIEARGSDGAGIGAGANDGAGSCGNIVIKSGTINAYGAGIGSAGIGGAYGANCGYISIEGGDIYAHGANGGAGIGGGNNGSSCGNITISGGNVIAESQWRGAGIGEGLSGTCGIITIGYGITKVQASLDPDYADYEMNGECIGSSYGSSNFVTVIVDERLSDTESNYTRIIQH